MATSESADKPVDTKQTEDTATDVKPNDKVTDDNKPTEDKPTEDSNLDESKPEAITDSAQPNDIKSNDIQPEEETKDDEKKSDDKPEPELPDFDAIDKALYQEEIGTNTNSLSFDDIKFENDEEKQGAIELAKELETKHKLTNLPPFEITRYYIGSKCRIPKASKKWLDTMDVYKKHDLSSITEQQMAKCFREMYKCMRFGGVDDKGRAIFAIKYSWWIPANFESTDVIMKCFLLILNLFTENLDYSRNGMIFIADCKDMGWANFDLALEKIFIVLMQEVYPLRVGAMYMLDPPLLLNIMMKICKPFLSKKMKERMHVIYTADMLKVVPKEQIPGIINGGEYDDTLTPMYHTCIRYMRRNNLDHFAPLEEEVTDNT